MSGRRSYRGLMGLPAFGLYDIDGKLVATVRADAAPTAAVLFRSGLPLDDVRRGVRVRRIGKP